MEDVAKTKKAIAEITAGNPIWLTWETQRRNTELAQAFSCVYGHYDYSYRPFWQRYPISAWQTVNLVFKSKTKVIFTQCPSLVLCSLILFLRVIKKFIWVIDAHNVAVEYARSNNVVLRFLMTLSLRSADFTIISNSSLSDAISKVGGRPLILPDKLPRIPQQDLPQRFQSVQRPILTLISTFASDEPIEEFIQGALAISQPYTLCITGKKSKAGELLRYASDKIIFTDFLTEEHYEGLIQHSDLLIDLTTREGCLVCGAYEALAVGVPIILSDTKVLRELFSCGAIFSANNSESFTKSLEEFLINYKIKNYDVQANRDRFNAEWNRHFENTLAQIIPRIQNK